MESTMKCSSLEKEQLVPLRDALNNLIRFLQRWKDNSIPYFYRYLQYMKDNIEICMYTQDDWGDGLAYLKDILQRNWDEANDDFMGIHSCPIFLYCVCSDRSSKGNANAKTIMAVIQRIDICLTKKPLIHDQMNRT